MVGYNYYFENSFLFKQISLNLYNREKSGTCQNIFNKHPSSVLPQSASNSLENDATTKIFLVLSQGVTILSLTRIWFWLWLFNFASWYQSIELTSTSQNIEHKDFPELLLWWCLSHDASATLIPRRWRVLINWSLVRPAPNISLSLSFHF